MFNGFLMPSKRYLKNFVVLDTDFKFNSDGADILKKVVVEIGINVPIPFLTLVLIKHKQEPIDLGTLNFMFTEYDEIEEIYTTTKLGYSFTRKSQERFKFDTKDILNIRSEINTNIEDGKQFFYVHNKNYEIDNFKTQFYTYLATILIELDPFE